MQAIGQQSKGPIYQFRHVVKIFRVASDYDTGLWEVVAGRHFEAALKSVERDARCRLWTSAKDDVATEQQKYDEKTMEVQEAGDGILCTDSTGIVALSMLAILWLPPHERDNKTRLLL